MRKKKVSDSKAVGFWSKYRLIAHGNMDLTFLMITLLLLTIGLVMMFSASYAYAYYNRNNSFHFISRQLMFAVVGLVAMIFVSYIDYHILYKFAWPLMWVSIVLLVVVLLMPSREDSKRWIEITGNLTFQPSEIAKFAIVVLFAKMISINYAKMKTFKIGIVPFMTILGVVAGLMMLEPHLSGTMLILLIGAVMIIVGGANLKWFGLAAVTGILLLGAVVMIPGVIGYATDRLAYWIDPWSDPLDKGFQTIQSIYAIGSGGLMGAGIGNSRQKYLYLPEPQNDFVFAIVCEELGFVGATLIILLFALLIWRGYVIAMKASDRFGAMIVIGLTTQIGLQVILNMMVVTNTIPNTGIALPFFSYGGTGLMMLLGQIGFILSVSRKSAVEKT